MITFEYLAIVAVSASDQVTRAAELTDMLSYSVVSYEPTVAPFARGSEGDYAEVTEPLVFHCWGATPEAAMRAYDDVVGLLDQAAAWALGDAVNAIQIRIAATNSSVGELSAVLLGTTDRPTTASPQWDVIEGQWVVRDVTATIRRRGLWLRSAEEASSASVTAGEIMTITLAEHPTPSPTAVAVTNTGAISAISAAGEGYLLLARAAANLQIYDPSAQAASGIFTNVADGTARGGLVRRATPVAAGAWAINSSVNLTIPDTIKRIHVFCNVRANNAGPQFLVRAAITGIYASQVGVVPQPLTAAWATILYLGAVERLEDVALPQVQFEVQVDSVAGSPTLDIDTFVLVGDDGSGTSIIALNEVSGPAASASFASLDPGPLQRPTPIAVSRASAWGAFVSQVGAYGDIWPQHSGTTLAGLLYLCGSPAVPTSSWRPNNGGTVVTTRLWARRWRGYRVPQ